uniref:Uncharacterized protein n=1 Tax=viral metagenome TaxID=1070528 RepID=A0A6C0C904_9ZZZZ
MFLVKFVKRDLMLLIRIVSSEDLNAQILYHPMLLTRFVLRRDSNVPIFDHSMLLARFVKRLIIQCY